MFETVLFEKKEAKAYITLNRPKVYNALNPVLIKELTQAIELCKNDDAIRVVIISGGNGIAFCSGADLKEGSGNPNLGETLNASYNPLIMGMRNLEKPIICKLDGMAAGAGMSLALAADIIIADENTYLTELFVGIGLMPDAGSMYFLPRLVGYQKTFELCSTGRKVFMQEALSLNLVSQIAKTEDLNGKVEKLADLYATAATTSIGQMKKVLNQSYNNSLETVLNLEGDAQTICGYSNDFREGVTAFMQKRAAVFTGK